MNKKSIRMAASVLLAFAVGSALAQALPQPLIEVARKAVVGNPEIQAKWREFTAAGHEHEFARSGQRPRLDLIASAGRQWTNNRPDLSTNLDYYRNGQGITLTQMLFDGFYTRNEISRLGYAKLVRYYELLESSENITLEAMRAYADVAKQLELVEAAKANYIEHKLITQLIEERTSAGVSRGVDLEQATGRLALAESNLITEISNLHDVSARYLRVVGERPADNVPPLPERLKLRGLPASSTQAMNEGLPSSPTINAAYENVRSAKAQVESNKSGYYPRLDFRAGQNWSNNYAGTAGSWTDAYAELALNYNLYRGGADMAREKQAIELRYQARDLQEKACRDVRQNLIIAYNDLTRLLDQLNFLDQHRLSTEKARQAYRQQFEIGQRTLLDMLNTQNEYFEASRAYTSARYNQIMAQARTLAGMGRLTATLGVTRPDQPTASDAGQDRGELPPDELCPFEAP
ncbi:MAG: TolC family outer membrane protein, partial [Hylemonella sp.]